MKLAAIATPDGLAVAAMLRSRAEQVRALGRLAALARRHGHAAELVHGAAGPVLYLTRREAGVLAA